MCAHLGDVSEKMLRKSHVVPRNLLMGLATANNIQPKSQFIVLSGNPLVKIDASQDQGATPMLCEACEQRLSIEIEKPTASWLRNEKLGSLCELDSVLLCRFAASVWWRAMISKHHYYQHIGFNYSSIYDIMAASLDAEKTLQTLRFRLRRLIDSTGGMTVEGMKNAVLTISGDTFSKNLSEWCPSFSLVAGGFRCDVFHPRTKQACLKECKCMEGQNLHEIPNWDIGLDPEIIEFGALQLAKRSDGNSSRSFRKRATKKTWWTF